METSLTNPDLLLYAYNQRMILNALVVKKIYKGFILRLFGVDVFLPLSEVACAGEMEPGNYVEVCILNPDGSVVVSGRKAEIIKRRNELIKAVDNMRVGDVYHGVTMEFLKKGVLVSVGGVLGLIPSSLLSWKYLEHPSELLSLGQDILVVLKSKEESCGVFRLIFSARDMEPDPWTDRLCDYVGKEVEGEVVIVKKYWAFLDFANVRGLVHKSEVSWDGDVDVRDYLYVGQKVRVKVFSVDIVSRKIMLSLKALVENPWMDFDPDCYIGKDMEVRVVRRAGGGLVVRVNEVFWGYIPGDDCAWVGAPALVKDVTWGSVLMARVMSIDIERRRFVLSVKALSDPPWLDLTKACSSGIGLRARIISICKDDLLLEVLQGVYASLKTGSLSIPYGHHHVGEVLSVRIVRIFWEKPMTIKVVVMEI